MYSVGGRIGMVVEPIDWLAHMAPMTCGDDMTIVFFFVSFIQGQGSYNTCARCFLIPIMEKAIQKWMPVC